MLDTRTIIALTALVVLALFFTCMMLYALKKDAEALKGRLEQIKELEERVNQLEASETDPEN